MSDMLTIGATGLRAYQTALTTVSENISNAGTVGYTRRTTAMREVAIPGIGTGTPNGVGVIVDGIVRNGDDIRTAAVRNAGADLSRTQTSVVWLDRIETGLTSNKLNERLTSFFNATKAVSADPTSLAPRSTMLEAAQSVAGAMTSTGRALDAASADLDATAETAVTNLNNTSSALARVNEGLSRTREGTSGHAQLLDERDRLLESMGQITDVTVKFDAIGRATVRGGNANGPVLVTGDSPAIVTYVRSGGAVSLVAHRDGETSALTPGAGSLAGLAEGAQRIEDSKAELNRIATDLAEGINAVQAGGDNLSGTPGTAIFEVGDPAYEMKMVMTDPRGIAAAATGGGTRNNANLAKFDEIRASGGFERAVTDLTAVNASALNGRRSVMDAQTAIRDAAVATREEMSGVNMDQEAIDLMRFQQAYQAASRVIQASRETFDALFNVT